MDNNALKNYMMKAKFYRFIDEETTDITYNGKRLFIEKISNGKTEIPISFTAEEAFDFVKHLADLCGKNFHYANPILDLAFFRYRLAAIHPSIAQVGWDNAVNFSLRITASSLRIIEKDSDYAPPEVFHLLSRVVQHGLSILIGGITGSGKSELQRYILSLISPNQRVIILQDSPEIVVTNMFANVSSWLYPLEDYERLEHLFKAGLRHNPDWFLLSEVRGKEASYLFRMLTSGIAIITTIHARSVREIRVRFLNLVDWSHSSNNPYLSRELSHHIHFYIYVRKQQIAGKWIRRIENILCAYIENDAVQEKSIFIRDNNRYDFFDLPPVIADKMKSRKEWFRENAD